MHYRIEGVKYVFGSELVIAARKGDQPVRVEEIEAGLPTDIRRRGAVAQRAPSPISTANTAAAPISKVPSPPPSPIAMGEGAARRG